MAVEYVHLRNFLRFDLADDKFRRRLIGSDVSVFLRPKIEDDAGGGDFFSPFWADAKKHTSGAGDLASLTAARVKSNRRRSRLYPLLRDGFLKWWTDVRRQTNKDLEVLRIPIKGRYEVDGVGVLRIENTLALRAHGEIVRVVYPYFSEEPVLTSESARLGLWIMAQALKDYPAATFEILDVVRGVSYRFADCVFIGDEEEQVADRYQMMVDSWWAAVIKKAPWMERRPKGPYGGTGRVAS